jgi:hypothetical protein
MKVFSAFLIGLFATEGIGAFSLSSVPRNRNNIGKASTYLFANPSNELTDMSSSPELFCPPPTPVENVIVLKDADAVGKLILIAFTMQKVISLHLANYYPTYMFTPCTMRVM